MHQQIKTFYDREVAKLKAMQVHDACSEYMCMFKRGECTSNSTIPTSEAARFLIKASSTALEVIAKDPVSGAVDLVTALPKEWASRAPGLPRMACAFETNPTMLHHCQREFRQRSDNAFPGLR